MNENIVNYLDKYITKEDIHFATLLKGRWGTGKTFFINNYIKYVESRNDNFKVKFIYISLFGLKNLESVNEIIFQQFHPILGSKTAKIATNVLKGALRIGINLDLNKDGKNETVNIDLSKTDFLSYFEGDKRKQAVFIFDDLERTQIPIGEILGFINGFVEHSGAKVIIICNEDEISKDSLDIYDKFKEKVINRSFYVQADMKSFWINYAQRFNDLSKNVEKIKDIFGEYGEGNLRVLSHVTENYSDFLNSVEERFKNNNEFMEALTEKYFIKSLCNKLNKEEVKKENDTDFDRTIRNLPFYSLFSRDDWESIIKGNFDKDLINLNIEKLVFFEDKKEEKSWVTLWHYLQRNEEELDRALIQTQESFENYAYISPAELIHVFSLLIYFKKMGIGDLSVESISNKIEVYINQSISSEEWANASLHSSFNGTGLGFYEQEDENINSLVKKVEEGIEKAKQNLKEKDFQNDIMILQHSFKNANIDNLRRLFGKYESQPILNQLDIKVFLKNFIKNNEFIMETMQLISYRYRENFTINSRSLIEYLSLESSFLQRLYEEIENEINNHQEINFHLLKLKTNNNHLKKIIERFNFNNRDNL